MRISSALGTHLGRVSIKNEDNFYYYDSILDDVDRKQYFDSKNTSLDSAGTLFAVFDGMGGMSAGEKASYIAASVAKSEFNSLEYMNADKACQLLESICIKANDEICKEMLSSDKKRMGSTAAMIYISNVGYCLCNIGDSPIFVYRKGLLTKISVEHSERELFERIHGTHADTERKFNLTQHLGIFKEEMDIEPYIACGGLEHGDKFFLCSDGLTDMVSLDCMSEIISTTSFPEETTKLLLARALENGGKDNITVICLEIKK